MQQDHHPKHRAGTEPVTASLDDERDLADGESTPLERAEEARRAAEENAEEVALNTEGLI